MEVSNGRASLEQVEFKDTTNVRVSAE